MKRKIMSSCLAFVLMLGLMGAVISSANAANTISSSDIVSIAKSLVGKYPEYKSGGISPSDGGFDCTGLVYYIYHTRLGHSISLSTLRSKSALASAGAKITNKADLQPGDIIQYTIFHVGIYIGNNTVVHAGSTNGVSKISLNSNALTFSYGVRLPNITQGSEVNTNTSVTSAGKASKPIVSVSSINVTVSWTYSGNASHYDVYLVQNPWAWEDIKYHLSTLSTSCTFENVRPGDYCAFVIARPNSDTVQSEWTDFTVDTTTTISQRLELPSNFFLSTDKDTYTLGESVVITPSADNVTHYAISIWRGAFKTGEMLYVDYHLSGGISFNPPLEGTYTIRADAKNENGYISEEKTFAVTADSNKGHWSKWSAWSSTPVSESNTRKVETRQVIIGEAHTEYRYGRFVDSTGMHIGWCSKYLESRPQVSGSAVLQYTDWGTTQYEKKPRTAWTCGYCDGTHIGVAQTSSDGRPWWSEYALPSGSYYWQESRTIPANVETQYRYCDWIPG